MIDLTLPALRAGYAAARRPGDRLAEVLSQVYSRIAAVADPGIFLHLRPLEELLAEAAALPAFDPAQYPLWGVPFAVKDNIDVEGCPTTAACPAFGYEPMEDAFAVAALRAAGALVIGKTNLDQFATGLVGVRTPHPVPRNALDPAIVPGGSSSGSAVAVAQGIVSFALGTDTAGSGRVPAALNGIVGLKPSLGTLSARGMVPACRTLDTISIFALTVPDAWEVFRTASAPDAGDAFARPPRARSALAPAPEALTIGVPAPHSRRFSGDTAQENAYAAQLARLAGAGHRLHEIDFAPFYEVAALLYEGPWVAERLAAMEAFRKAHPEAIHPVTERIVGKAEAMSAADAFRGLYRLTELRHALAPVIASVDLFCLPSVPRFYALEDLARDPIGPNSDLGTYTNFVNLLDMCALAVPMRDREDGRPGSVTLIAGHGKDDLLAALGARIAAEEAALIGATGLLPPPPVTGSVTGPVTGPDAGTAGQRGELVLAAVGAHMSGMALNHELTGRGGRFLEATQTAPAYRLHALAGGPPHRPGLVRSATGAAIALELWALPLAEVGSFLQGIPSPLGLGKVRLADGREVTGFLCEDIGLAGARDITGFGGWRAFVES